MPSNRRGARFWVSVWLPVALAMGVIALESTEFMGADHTTGPLRRVWEWLFGPVSDLHWDLLHHLVRKTGHFVGYGCVGLAWLRAWWKSMPRSRFLTDAALALAGTALVASADELHQSFLPNRTGSPWDVLLDCSGALALQLAVYLYLRLLRPRTLRRA